MHLQELQLLLELLIEATFLSVHKATFTEHFFYLERNPVNKHKTLVRLFQACFLPYMMDRLETLHTNLVDRRVMLEKIGELDEQKSFTKFEIILLNNYINLKRLSNILKIVFWIAYATSSSKTHCPSLWLVGDRIQSKTSLLSNDGTSFGHRMARGIQTTMTCFTFMVQFLQYWYNHSDVSKTINLKKHVQVPAPLSHSMNIPSNTCPLCLASPRHQPTALATSGQVFCHVCIVEYLKTYGRCPVTSFPSSIDQLIRLFDE